MKPVLPLFTMCLAMTERGQMAVQDTPNTGLVQRAAKVTAPARHTSTLLGRWARSRRSVVIISILILSDALLALAIWQGTFIFRAALGLHPVSTTTMISIVPNFVAWVGLRAALGLYPGYGLGYVEELRRQTFALLATLAITTVFAFASQVADTLSRLSVFVWALALLLVAPVVRHFMKLAMAKAGLWGKPVAVVGVQEAGAQVLKALQREWHLGFKPIAVFDTRVAPTGGVVQGVPYLGTLTDAMPLARNNEVDTIIFAIPQTRRKHLAQFVDLASLSFRHVVIIPNLDGITNSAVVARDLGGIFGLEMKYNLLNPWAQRLKRTMDIVATIIGGCLVFPLILMLSILVWAESRGPIFYSDLRIGRDGKLFPCVKFRTMVVDAETLLQQMLSEDEEMRNEYLNYHKLRNDPRVTRVGRFLRKTSLDELPQLWNVLRGEMSLVGPRPYLPRESDDIGTTQSEILRVTPGMTGPWQVSGRNHTSFSERVRMDACYVRDWSVWLDIVLLARTVGCLLSRRDAY
jgi:Undecaprenyl-phosphate galactose phosphotransferase WbaP